MFNLLKNKIGGFIDSLSKKVKGEEKLSEETIETKPLETAPLEPIQASPAIEIKQETTPVLQANVPKIEEHGHIKPEPATLPIHKATAVEKAEKKETKEIKHETKPTETKLQITKPIATLIIKKEEKTKQIQLANPINAPVAIPKSIPSAAVPIPPTQQIPTYIEKKELKAKEFEVAPSFMTRLKSVVMPEVTIKDSDISSVIEEFEMQLLTADVALPVVEEIAKGLKSKLVGSSVKSSQLDNHVKKAIFDTILDVTRQESFDIVEFAKTKEKPLRILFIGPNGAGKTTAIAKFAHLLKKNGLTCVIAAADTFRAAAIEQTMEHAKRLEVPVIRHDYGSDPAAVSFDTIKYAKAKGIDVVLIDSAGRQETNRNLIEQLKKIERVAQPDLKIFVGEGIAGNAVLTQVTEFHKAIGLDGVILTKLDVDAKGGTVISIKKATGVPILYIGVGQGYDDLIPFDPNYVAKRIMAA